MFKNAGSVSGLNVDHSALKSKNLNFLRKSFSSSGFAEQVAFQKLLSGFGILVAEADLGDGGAVAHTFDSSSTQT